MGYLSDCCAVRCRLDDEELLCQLAEEAVELSMAARDVAGVYCENEVFATGAPSGGIDAMLEEIADVELVIEILLEEHEIHIMNGVINSDRYAMLVGMNWFSAVNMLGDRVLPLAKAAMKFRRARNGKNPTPVTWEEAKASLMASMANVLALIGVVKGSAVLGNKKVYAIKEKKAARWAKRLTEGVERDGNVQQDPEELLGNG